VASTEKLDEYIRLTSSGLEPSKARQALRIPDKTLDTWMRDPKVRPRLEAAIRMVAPPDVRDDEPTIEPGSLGSFPWERYTHDNIGRLRAIDNVLSQSGFHAMSPWWDWTFDCFYASGKLQFVCRDGRRGGKSSDTCRVAVSEGIGVERHLSPGEAGTWFIISHTMPEANDRLDTIEKILGAMAFRQVDKKPEEFGTFQRTTELGRKLIRSLDVKKNVIEWTVYPPTINGVSGPTGIGASCDEAAKWRDDKTGANPASVVLESLRPCFATQPDARLYLISSALSTIDAHHDAIEAGDTDIQFLARLGQTAIADDIEQRQRAVDMFMMQAARFVADEKPADASIATKRAKSIRDTIETIVPSSANIPTWVSNPSLSIERTLLLEPDFDVWLREYASVPTGGGLRFFFDHQTIDRTKIVILTKRIVKRVAVGIDPGLETNSFTACALGLDDDGAWLLDMIEMLPLPGSPLDDEESFATCAEFAVKNGGTSWATDGHYIATARRIGAKSTPKIATIRAPNDNGKVFLDFRREANRGKVQTGGHEYSQRLARQLKETMSRAMSGDRTQIILKKEAGGAHGDLASAFVRAWWLLTSKAEDRKAAFGKIVEQRT
jgi:hypothetical protein